MHDSKLNPYAAPATVDSVLATPSSARPWKAIAWRWERLRLLFNAVVGMTGVAALAMNGRVGLFEAVEGAILYGLAANAFYSFGPLGEMYLNWLGDVGERRFLPGPVVDLIRSSFITWLMFLVGTLFSVLVTLVAGLTVQAWPM